MIHVGISLEIKIDEQRGLRAVGGVLRNTCIPYCRRRSLAVRSRSGQTAQESLRRHRVVRLQPDFRRAMFGNCAIGKSAIAIAPTITVRIAITIATMGRRMKNSPWLALLAFFCKTLGSPLRAFRTFSAPTATTRSPGFRAGCDYPKRVNSRTNCHGPELRRLSAPTTVT